MFSQQNDAPVQPPVPSNSLLNQHYEALAFKAVREGNAHALKALLGSPAYVFERTRKTRAAIERIQAKLEVANEMVEYLRELNPRILREQKKKGEEVPQERRQQIVEQIKKDLVVRAEKMLAVRIPEIMERYAAFTQERLKHWEVNPAEQIELARLFLTGQFQEPVLASFLKNLLTGKKAPAWGELFHDIQTYYKNRAAKYQNELDGLQATLQRKTSVAEKEYIKETADWSLSTEAVPFIAPPQGAMVEVPEGFAEEPAADQPGPSRKGKEKYRAPMQSANRAPVQPAKSSVNSQDSVESLMALTEDQQRIIQSRVNPNAVNEQGDTLLLCALRPESTRNSHVIRHLLFGGAESRIGDASLRHLTPIDIILEMPETSDRDILLGIFFEQAEMSIRHPLFIERRYQLYKPENWESLQFILKTHAVTTVYLDAQTPENKSTFITLWETLFKEMNLAPTVLNAAVAIEMQRKARKSLLSTDPLTLVAEVKNTVGKSIFSKLAKSVGSRIFGPLDGFYKDYRAKMEKLGHPDISKALIQQGAINQVERGVLIAEVALLKRELRESNAEKEGLRQDKAVLQERVREKDEEIVALKEDNGVKDEKLLVQDEKLLVQDEKLLVQDERLREKDEQLREKDVRLLARDEIIVLLRKNVEEQNEKNRALEQRLLRVEAALMLPADTNIAAAEFSPPLLPLAAASSSSSSTTTVVASYRELQRKNSRSSSDSEENEQRKNSSSSSVLGEDLDKKGPVNEDENGDNKENSHSPQTYRLM